MTKEVVRGTGFTESERYLASLADKAFLRLWSYPNTFIDKKSGGKGDGKELADLLVVFGDDVIIFSDKEIEWPSSEDKDLAWSRWYRRAVAKSADQVRGAERWLTKFEKRVFIDKCCEHPFPIDLPPLASRRVHGIVVALGANDMARQHFNDPRGTFAVIPSIEGNDHVNKTAKDYHPFAIGDVNPNGSFVHVFDPVALDLVLAELDTVSDFLDYLTKREAFIRSGRLLVAGGEEDLVAAFIQNGTPTGERSFLPADLPADITDHSIVIPAGEYDGFIALPEYRRKKEADEVSYNWDRLIEIFVEHVLAGTSVEILETAPDVTLAERGLRFMAAENRIYRRVLGQNVEEALQVAEAEKATRFIRNMIPTSEPRQHPVGYVFLILAYPGDDVLENGYTQYREHRTSMLQTYCYNLFDMRSDLETVVGIAVDASEKVTGRPGGSEDLLVVAKPEWTVEFKDQFERARKHYGLKPSSELRTRHARHDEFPLEGAPFASRQQRRAAERKAAKKRRKI